MGAGQVSRYNQNKRNRDKILEIGRKYNEEHRDEINSKVKENIKKRCSKGSTACKILKKHHDEMKDDPEHLTTEFLQKLIGTRCKNNKGK